MSDNLPDLRPVEVLRDQADAWSKVISLCLELGAPSKPTGLATVLDFIRDLHRKARKYDRLMKYVNSKQEN